MKTHLHLFGKLLQEKQLLLGLEQEFLAKQLHTTKQQSGKSGNFCSLSPLPSTIAVPHSVQNGTSLPTKLPNSANAKIESGSP